MLSSLAFVDVETTGLSPKFDRIIEIGILCIERGKIKESFNSLVNPGRPVPAEITRITGISGSDLETAPSFFQIAPEILGLLENRMFVAHNVRFDYGFLRHELKRQGVDFSAKLLCTARLSRRLFPSYPHHNLDSIIERFGLSCTVRHRALDDARMAWEFFRKCKKLFPKNTLSEAISHITRRSAVPAKLAPDRISTLPETPGVYIFYDDNHLPLYIGKSINIKERVLSHFSADLQSGLEMKLSRLACDIQTFPTAGELGALLLESTLVKTMQPAYNRQLRHWQTLVVVTKKKTGGGYFGISVETLREINVSDLNKVLGVFRSQKQAKKYLEQVAKEYSLCAKLLGLEKTKGCCFSYHLGWCKGACVGKEDFLGYNIRFIQAFSKNKIKPWPFAGPVAIKEKDELSGRTESFIFDKWCYLGNTKEGKLSGPRFDKDIYRILLQQLFNPHRQQKIRQLSYQDLKNCFNDSVL